MSKKPFFILFFLLFAQLCIARTTIIAGHFDKPQSQTVTLQFRQSLFAKIEGTTMKLEVMLQANNTFSFEIETENPFTFHLLNGDKWIMMNKYASVGDRIYFNFKEKETIMTSNCEACLAFDFEWVDKFFLDTTVKRQLTSSYSLNNPDEFSHYWSKRRRDQLQFLNKFFTGKELPSDFKNYMESEINYEYAIKMLQYPSINKEIKDALKDPVYMSFLDSVSLTNLNALNSGKYILLLKELPLNLYSSLWTSPNVYYSKNRIKICDSIAKIYFTSLAYDIALYQIVLERIKSLEKEKSAPEFSAKYKKLDSLLFIYSTNFKDPSFSNRLKNKLENLNQAQKPAPDFVLKDLKGKEVRLSDFKGKVVYLNFWATTCGPCVAEIPKANELMQNFANKDFVFLCVSMDNSTEKVKSFISSKSFNGIHLIETKGTASKIAEQYEITYFPHYFLIDKQGFLASTDAPRPSKHPEELIEKLLLQN